MANPAFFRGQPDRINLNYPTPALPLEGEGTGGVKKLNFK